jgi:hypothetical protein
MVAVICFVAYIWVLAAIYLPTMKFLKKIFGQSNKNDQPTEPIFPGESFSISKLTLSDGWGLATFNNKYNQYPNKVFFPWHVLVELEIVDKNDNGHPVDTDAERLAKLEEEILSFLQQKHTVHFLVRVTRNGFRDLLYYVDQPKFEQAEVNAFCDNIMKERGINFRMEKDPTWTAVSGFIK